jgi:hypothetical protein
VAQLVAREPPQILVHQRNKSIERGRLPLLRGPQQPGDFADI